MMQIWRPALGALIAAAVLATTGCGGQPDPGRTTAAGSPTTASASGNMVLATTTSTRDTGLLDAILPAFQQSSACVTKTVAVGSGQAMTMGEKGDADVLLVHSPQAEETFMAAGHGSSRAPVMHNDFVLVGPASDPAHVAGAGSAAKALSLIAQQHAPFASRADSSGTNAKELALWKQAGVTPKGSWYIETGQGMGATLTIASQKQAYTLSDRGTFLASSNLESKILSQGTPDLLNPYHVIVVKHGTTTNVGCAQKFAQWITSPPVQQTIGHFGVEKVRSAVVLPRRRDVRR